MAANRRRASTIVGIGVVSGREVIVRADDPTIKGGAWYPLSVKKIVRALDIAMENRLPVIHLCDSAGGFLQLQSEVFPDRYMAGRIFRNQSLLSKMGVKQLALVFGHCTAGGAYIPALSDYNVIVRGTGAVFLGGPPLVRAATGEEVGVEELGGADMHTSVSGVCDYPAADEAEAIHIGREIVAQWDRPRKWDCQREPVEPPAYDPGGDLRHPARRHPAAVRHARDHRAHRRRQPLPRIPAQLRHDAGLRLRQYLGLQGRHPRQQRRAVQRFRAQGRRISSSCATRTTTPLVFLQNITGYMVGREYERRGITKDGAKMIMAQACSRVPKFTVMCNGSFGAGNYGMCGRAFDARLLFAWPNHQIGVMGGEQAANTLAEVKLNQMQAQRRRRRPERDRPR